MSDVIEVYLEKQRAKGKRGGLNLPAMSRKEGRFMSCIQADEDHLFVSQDVVSLEPTITSEMSQDPLYMYATVTGIGQRPKYVGGILMIDDIYLMSASIFPTTTSLMYDIFHDHKMPTGLGFADQWLLDSEVCKDYCKNLVRNYSKVACLGIGYGMGHVKFYDTANESGMPISKKEAKGTIAAYWETYKNLAALRDGLAGTVRKTGFVVNPFGYRCTPEPHKAFNAFIQSSASGVLDVYCLKLFHAAPWLKFVTLIHDEVIFMCPKNRVQEMQRVSDECIESLNQDLKWSVPIRFGTKIGETFSDLK